MKKILLLISCGGLILFQGSCRSGNQPSPAGDSTIVNTDPLPSWKAGPLKEAILEFVSRASTQGDAGFIPEADRIATFDNDGTLWSEKPLVQELFAVYQVKKMVEKTPSLAKTQPFKAVLEQDKAYFQKGGKPALMKLVTATHTGMTVEEFEQDVRQFLSQAIYPGRNVPVLKLAYQPQVELLNYLRKNGFKTYICTGGTIDFVRGISDSMYGIPKEQVIGTTFRSQFIDSNRTIMRLPEITVFNDQEAKPVSIEVHIGKKPVFACGNEGGAGDIAMLKYCQSNNLPSFQLLINHDDSTREAFYQEKDSTSLKAAASNNWHVVSMKNDWMRIYRDN